MCDSAWRCGLFMVATLLATVSAQSPNNTQLRRSLLPTDAVTILRPPLLTRPISTYPVYDTLLNHLTAWNPDNPDPPSLFRETLQHFNFSDPVQREIALSFREAELPFKLYDVPNVNEVVKKWSNEYLASVLERDTAINTLTSKNNHFQYWKKQKEGGKAGSTKLDRPTGSVKMPFKEWLAIVQAADRDKLAADQPHYYFRKNNPADEKQKSFVGRDLSIFSTSEDNFFISDVSKNKGIQCRFGMRGIIAESHWDSGRNMVAVLKGRKRYILNPPRACHTLGVEVNPSHPSFRHSLVDWSDLEDAKRHEFNKAESVETIVNAREVLYIPSNWFHYVISLEYNIQCNSRSGTPPKAGFGENEIRKCVKKGSNYQGKKSNGWLFGGGGG